MFPEDLIESAGTRLPETGQTTRFVSPDSGDYAGDVASSPPKTRLWLHLLLLVLTMFTTTLVGAHMQYNFSHNLPFFDLERDLDIFTVGLRSPALFAAGLPFSLTLLTILMAHELGHYVACVYYGVDATLPFFLPAPTPFTGTLGAFIRIRSAIYSKRVLFDIGVAGPLAGFIFLIPALGVGLAFSKIIPGINHQGAIQLGTPALEWLLQRMIFPGVPAADIYLHPVARAAWVGMFATALNLLPVGQLDGGHIVYALLGRSHKWITHSFLLLLLPMGRWWNGWWLWAVVLFFLARKHPPVYDRTDIGRPRVQLGMLALVVFILCFSITPIID
ncbi:MAG: site-2 protease family protein [Acidobacteriota bacterium]|nr:site-2 protease family protein [Acidobacteriota bacterium]